MIETDSSKISPTAHITSYAWSQLKIANADYFVDPLAKKIIRFLRLLASPYFLNKRNDYTYNMLEPRHKAIDYFINNKFPSRQIVEIAAGLSPRGITFAANPEITYIEADLPKIIQKKQQQVQKIYKQKNVQRDNHKFVELDLLHDDLAAKVGPFLDKNEPLTVITEGLTPYFDMEHLKIMFLNIKKLLDNQAGGVYITDIYHDETMRRNMLNHKMVRFALALIQAHFKTDIDNVSEGESFMKECGFDFVETINPLEVAKQIGLKNPIPPENGVVTIYLAHVF